MTTRCEVDLSCGHVQWLFDTTAPVASPQNDEAVAWFLKPKKDGWWAARRCLEGCGRRKVVNVRQFLLREVAA